MKNQSWSMTKSSKEAVEGFIAFLNGKLFEENPYNTEVKYKNWASGWRDGKDATSEQIKMFNWIYSR